MKRLALAVVLLSLGAVLTWIWAKAPAESPEMQLPSTKVIAVPGAGHIASLNSFPTTIGLSPDGRYAALLNDGYGTEASQIRQSIAILDLNTNQVTDFPDARFAENALQTYFIGLAFSSDGKHVYASVGSITDPTGEHPGDTGNGIAVYSFADGKLSPERFIKIELQQIAAGKRVPEGLATTKPGTAIPYPAGIAVVSDHGADQLLIADNSSDNVVLMDVATGRVQRQFDLSKSSLVPSAYPYTVVVSRDHRRACAVCGMPRVSLSWIFRPAR